MIKVVINEKTYKVRYYGKGSGIYSISDEHGEHEVGLWEQTPLLDRYGKPKKTQSMFEGRPFYDVEHPYRFYSKTDLAYYLVSSFIQHQPSHKI